VLPKSTNADSHSGSAGEHECQGQGDRPGREQALQQGRFGSAVTPAALRGLVVLATRSECGPRGLGLIGYGSRSAVE
jgi:hypothetical protein